MSLDTYIKSSGVDRATFAEQAGISVAHLSRIISGERKPSLEVARRIRDVTDGAVPVSAFFTEIVEELERERAGEAA